MQIITRNYKVYKFSELLEEAQEKAIESHYDCNVDYDWYNMTTSDDFPVKLSEIGLSGNKFYFSLDRDNYLYCDNLAIDNIEKILKAIKVDLRSKEAKSILENGLSLNKTYYAGGIARNTIDLGYGVIDTAKSIDIERALRELLQNTLEEFRSILSKEYDYLTSREAIIDTIESNDWTFTENGKMFNL